MSKKNKKALQTVELIGTASTFILGNKKLQKIVCGTYSNGKPRSISDAIHGEIVDPKDKKMKVYKYMEKQEKKKKKNKKKKNKKKSPNFASFNL